MTTATVSDEATDPEMTSNLSEEDAASSGDAPWDLISTPARSSKGSRSASPSSAEPVTLRLRDRREAGLTKDTAVTEMLTESGSTDDVHRLLMMATQAGAHGE